MKKIFEYDEESDGLYIWFTDIDKHKKDYDSEIRPEQFNDEVGFLLDKNGKMMGVEIQPCSKYIDVDKLPKE